MKNPEILAMLDKIDSSLDHELHCTLAARAEMGCLCDRKTAHVWAVIQSFRESELLLPAQDPSQKKPLPKEKSQK